MKNVVDQIRLMNYPHNTLVYCFIRKKFRALLGNEIVFNLRTLTIKRPTIDNNKTYSIRTNKFEFPPGNVDVEELLGYYNVVQVDEDTFKLKKVKNA